MLVPYSSNAFGFDCVKILMLALSGDGGGSHLMVRSTQAGIEIYEHHNSSSSAFQSVQVSPSIPPLTVQTLEWKVI